MDAEGISEAAKLKAAGIPFIIRGHQGWAKFTDKWIKHEAKPAKVSNNTNMMGISPKSNSNKVKPTEFVEVFDLDIKQIIKDIGDESVPVVRPNYNPEDPIKKHITVQE